MNSSQDNEQKPIFISFTKMTLMTLHLWLSEPKTNRGHANTKINQHVKYESPVINCFQDNDRKPFGLPTDRRTDGPTLCKTICPSSKGDIKINTKRYGVQRFPPREAGTQRLMSCLLTCTLRRQSRIRGSNSVLKYRHCSRHHMISMQEQSGALHTTVGLLIIYK